MNRLGEQLRHPVQAARTQRRRLGLHLRRMEFYGDLFRAGDLVFDIGAHVGDRTALFLSLGARVVAVEPQEQLAQHLRRRFSGASRVTVVQSAAGARSGEAEIAICDDETVLSTLSERWRNEGRFAGHHAWTQLERVPMRTLDELCATYGRPAFCKIDVEGFEKQVLAGLSSSLPVLCFEFTSEFLDDAHACIARLEALGIEAFNYTVGEEPQMQVPLWVPSDALFANLPRHSNRLLWGDMYARTGPGYTS